MNSVLTPLADALGGAAVLQSACSGPFLMAATLVDPLSCFSPRATSENASTPQRLRGWSARMQPGLAAWEGTTGPQLRGQEG